MNGARHTGVEQWRYSVGRWSLAPCGGLFADRVGRDSLLLGMGLAVLANSRPYEGLVASLPVAVALLVWMLGKKGPRLGVSIAQVALPILAVLALTGGAMGFYNWRLTGDAFRMPYQVYEDGICLSTALPLAISTSHADLSTHRYA